MYFRDDYTPSTQENLSEKLFIPQELHQNRLKMAVELFNQHIPKVSVLDVGCGYGHLIPHIQDSISSYKGIDPDAHAVSYAEQHYVPSLPAGVKSKFLIGGMEALKREDAADVVFCLGVAAFLKPTEEALTWFIESLCHVAKKAVIIEFQNSNKYSGFFTSFTPDQVSKVAQRIFNRRTFLESESDSVFVVRIPLV